MAAAGLSNKTHGGTCTARACPTDCAFHGFSFSPIVYEAINIAAQQIISYIGASLRFQAPFVSSTL
jgi:hypothetical protein